MSYSERNAVKSFPVLANAQTLWNVKNDQEKKIELTFQLSLQYRFQSANCTSLNEYSKKKKGSKYKNCNLQLYLALLS